MLDKYPLIRSTKARCLASLSVEPCGAAAAVPVGVTGTVWAVADAITALKTSATVATTRPICHLFVSPAHDHGGWPSREGSVAVGSSPQVSVSDQTMPPVASSRTKSARFDRILPLCITPGGRPSAPGRKAP